MAYYATAERIDGKIETVSGILKWEIIGPFIYLNGTDFEIFLSSSLYALIEINEDSL
jgi:hypothetical protein